MEKLPSETRENDLDKQSDTSTFDYFIDQYQNGKMSYADAIQAYTEVMIDRLEQHE